MDKGWIKNYRTLKGKGFYKKSSYVHLWIHLLLSVNHKKKEYMTNGNIIIIKEGQILTGRKQLSGETGIPEITIERILDLFEKEGQIEQQKTTKYRLITILNWKDYQERTTEKIKKVSKRVETGQQESSDNPLEIRSEKINKNDSDNKWTTNGQQMDTNKNVKNVRSNTIPEQSSKEIPEIIKAFEFINPACKRMYGHKGQRAACQNLIDEYGFERVISVVMKTLPKTNGQEFFPTITTPTNLMNKWASLEVAITRYRSKKKEGNFSNVIL